MPLRFGDLVFDTESRQLLKGDSEVHLSPKAFQLLELLIERRPAVATKQQLLDEIWQGQFVEEENVKNLIAEVRRALGEESPVIRTVHRVGYAFSGEVVTVGREPDARWFVTDGNTSYPIRGSAVIGRSTECDIQIRSLSVSRMHARITVTPSGVAIEDLGSKNGTKVGGQRIEAPTPIRERDVITVGSVSLTLHSDAALTTTLPPQ